MWSQSYFPPSWWAPSFWPKEGGVAPPHGHGRGYGGKHRLMSYVLLATEMEREASLASRFSAARSLREDAILATVQRRLAFAAEAYGQQRAMHQTAYSLMLGEV